MPKKSRIIEFNAKRRPEGGVQADLRVSWEFNDADRRAALDKLLGATVKVAEMWDMTDALNEAMRRLSVPVAEAK